VVVSQSEKEEDMKRKLRFFEAIQAFREGKLPTNDQLINIITRFQRSRDLENRRTMLSRDGQVVLDDFTRLLSSLKRIIVEKNGDEDIQSFIFHSRMATIASQDARVRSALYESGKSVGKTAQEGFSAASSIARLLVTNNEFRALLLDLSELFQDVLAGFSERRRERARREIGDDDLDFGGDREGYGRDLASYGDRDSRRYADDRERERDRGLDRDRDYTYMRGGRGGRYDPAYGEDDDLRRDREGVSRNFSYSYYEPTSQVQTDGGDPSPSPTPIDRGLPSVGPPFVASERKTAPVSTTRDDVRDYPSPPRSYMDRDDQGRTNTSRPNRRFDYDEYYGGAGRREDSFDRDRERDTAAATRESFREALPESYRGYADDAQDIIGERFTVERRQRLVERFRRICEDLSGNEEYHEAIKYLLSAIERIGDIAGVSGSRATSETTRRMRKDANLLAAERELRRLVEKFANGQSLDPIIDQLEEFAYHIKEDFYLRDFLRDLRDFIYRSLEDPRYVTSRDYDRKGSEIINRGRAILFESYRNDTSNLLNNLRKFSNELQSDNVTREFAEDITRFTKDMFLDEEGRYTFKPDLIRDITTVVLPLLFEQIRYIPIPRIEHNDEQYHIIMENLIITSDNFLPNVLEVKMKNAVVMGLRKNIESTFNSHVTINMYQIYADIRDVPWYYKKKKGFPKMSDHGVLSTFVGGNGISILIKLGLDKENPNRTIFVRRVRTHVDDLRIDIRGEKHEALYTLFGPIIHTLVRTQIQKTVEQTVHDWISYLDEQATTFKNAYAPRADEALGAIGSVRGAMGRFINSMGLGRSGSSTKAGKKEGNGAPAGLIEGPGRGRSPESADGNGGRSTSWRSDRFAAGR